MVAFALLMLLIGGLLTFAGSAMMKRGNTDQFQAWKVIAGGAGVGLLTGILGVGGGFLIVPALVMLVGLPMHHAVGTSLVVIAMNSAAGFLGHMSSLALDLPLISVFVAAGIAGTFAGVRLGKRLEANMLRRAFAVFVIVLAVFLLIDNLPKIGIIL